MQYRRLGRSGLKVSPLCLGTMMFGAQTDEPHSARIIARAKDGGLELEGAAKVESISIREPEEFRAHVLGEEFFNAAEHPEVRFRSSSIELSEDGRARVTGELEVAGITREVTAAGTYREPIDGPDGNERVAFELETKFDRRDFGFDWQMELPSGGDVLDWDVTLNVHLELVKAGEDA